MQRQKLPAPTPVEDIKRELGQRPSADLRRRIRDPACRGVHRQAVRELLEERYPTAED